MATYIKFDGIDGDVTAAGFEKFIEVLQFSWGVTQTGTLASGSGAGTGRTSFQDFHFQHNVDRASPKLMQACALGTQISTAEVDFLKTGASTPYLKIRLQNVLITGLEFSGSGDLVAAEDVGFTFGKIEYDFTPQRADGSLDSVINVQLDLRALGG
jgi:type VI secretion system secreted protein Hcp